jgi:flavorubredoxin
MPVQLKDGIYWVGAIDWKLRDFHGYTTFRGATYNSYLIVDEKITLVDTVKVSFYQEMLERIRQIVDPSKIDYLICNHVEMDHSGSLPKFSKQFPNLKIYCTKAAQTGLTKYYGPGLPLETVKTGDMLKLGKRTLQFLEVPMVHWPDSMFSYIPEDKLLLSNDGFGQHIATSGRFDDEVDENEVMYEAAKYYANLLMHLSPLIQNTLKKVTDLKLEIDMIAPSHGIIWRKDPGKIIKAYNDWSLYKSRDKVLIIYDTMWNSTEKMASTLLNTIMDAGVEAKLLKLRSTHRSDIMTDILDAKGLLIGSPTLHRNMFPTLASFLCYMKGLKPQKKVAAAFGSYGWSGEAVQQITDVLNEIKLDVIEPGVKAVYVPDDHETEQVVLLAKSLLDRIKGS